MKKIFDYSDYKKYVNDRIYQMPKNGFGQYRKIAEHLEQSSVVVSQIFKGKRDLSDEHALLLSEYFALLGFEKEYFLLLIQYNKAAHFKLKKHYETKLKAIAQQGTQVSNLIKLERLTEQAQAQFYSDWKYTAVLLSILLPHCKNIDQISEHLGLTRAQLTPILEFLMKFNLVAEEKGKLKVGMQRMHLESTSPLVARHHTNWRLMGLQHVEDLDDEEIFYSSPMTVSSKVLKDLRKMILNFIVEASDKIKTADDETIACLNIDLFKIEKSKY